MGGRRRPGRGQREPVLKHWEDAPFRLFAGLIHAAATVGEMTLESRGGAGEASAKSRKPTIVIVDDCEVTLASTAEVLDRAGYRVITRDRPAGCVAMMLQEKPDLVLLDVCMPTVSGDTLVKLFSKASPNSGTIILLYSALDEPLLRSKAKSSGAHGYVSKTNDGALLLRAIRRWLRPSLIDVRVPLTSASRKLDVPQAAQSSGPSASSVRPSASSGSTASLRAVSISSAGPRHASVPLARASAEHSSPSRARVEHLPSSRLRELDIRSSVSGEMRRTSGSFAVDAPRVLFVDDDMLALSGYRRQLAGQPFEFDFALSGNQALRLLTSATPPSVIVSDLFMSEPNGREVLRRALDHDPSWNRRFVIVTGLELHEARSHLDSRFYGALLRKPVERDALSSAIRDCLAAIGMHVLASSGR
jgi:two-component system, OmpR family, response regulator